MSPSSLVTPRLTNSPKSSALFYILTLQAKSMSIKRNGMNGCLPLCGHKYAGSSSNLQLSFFSSSVAVRNNRSIKPTSPLFFRRRGKRSTRDDIRLRRRYQGGRKIGGKIQRGILALQLRGMSGNPPTDPYICLRLDPRLPTPAKPYVITHYQSHYQEPTHPLNLDFCRIGTKPPPLT